MREQWPSRMIFIFAAVGSAAGLGNLWRFPYLAYEYGGGAFLIPYLLALLVVGLPLLILEFVLGRKHEEAAVGSLRRLKSWGGAIGWWALGCGFIILSYYAGVMAWSFRYLLDSFTVAWSSGAQDHFFGNVLQITDSINVLGGLNWMLVLCLLAVWILIYFSIWKGIDSVSKVVKITMPLPIILLLILALRAVTLDGASDGLLLYMTPSLAAIMDPQVWVAAISQIFFTLTLGFGVMIAYGSYCGHKSDVAKDAIWTAVLNSMISIIAGFVVFGTLGFLAMQQGVGVPDVVASGPGLAFVVFPEALAVMPMPALFSVLFFIVVLSLGIDSAFSLIEGVNAALKDKLKKVNGAKIALITSVLCFLLGLLFVTRAGLYYLDVVDHFVTNYALVLVGIVTCLLAGWTTAGEGLKQYVAKSAKWFPTELWWWLIKLVTPVLLIVFLVSNFIAEMRAPYEGYPGWAIMIGWAAVFLPLVVGYFLNKWYEGVKA